MSEAIRTRAGAYLTLAAGLAGLVLGAGQVAGGALLLHPGPGALATAGFLLALALGTLAAAFWVGGVEPAQGGGVWWVIAVVLFLVASPFAEAWSGQAWLRESSWGRAAAVLLLVALPAYAVGSVLAQLQGRGGGTTVGALTGAGVGAAIAATLLIPKFDPGVLFAGGAIVLIAASWLALGGRSGRGEMEMAGRRVQGLEGKVAIVTGAGTPGQVGYAVAEALVREGVRVVMTARTEGVVEVARGVGGMGEVVGVAADLTSTEEADRVVATARERFGGLDLLVNVAGGLTVMKPLAETTTEEWARELERNARTAFVLSRAALPALRERRGAIINFASPAGLRARAGIGAYSAAKAAVVALTRSLALEERANGVRVNAIAPGLIDTAQNRAAFPEGEEVAWVSRRQVVDAVLFLASELGDGVNGATLEVVGEGVE